MSPSKPLAPPGLSRTFYKRELPTPPAVAFSSEEGQAIFRDALTAGTMQGFFRLVEQFRTQDEPAYCGLASVAMVLNALAIDPRRAWKGPWRFFHEQMLDCCHPLEKVRTEGITLEQAACLARCNGADVQVYPFGSVSLDDFRALVQQSAALTSPAPFHLIVSYTRKAFLQTGDGHFSPIGGYSPQRDMVLILDTARFKYPPHWVALEELYKAQAAVDSVTGQPRGFMKLGLPALMDSVLFTLDVRDERWIEAFSFFGSAGSGDGSGSGSSTEKEGEQRVTGAASAALAASRVGGATAKSVIGAVAAAAPATAVKKFIAVRMAGNSCNGGVCTQTEAIDTFLHELRSMPLFQVIAESVAVGGEDDGCSDPDPDIIKKDTNEKTPGLSAAASALSSERPAAPGPLLPERLTMLLLLGPLSTWRCIDDDQLRKEIEEMVDVWGTFKIVGCELRYLKEQYNELPAVQRALLMHHDRHCIDDADTDDTNRMNNHSTSMTG